MSKSARINLDNCETKPFEIHEDLNIKNKTKYLNTGNQQNTKLSQIYYSQENIDYIQNQIISQVFEKTNNKHLIGKQDENELVIVMKSIFIL